MHIEKIKLNKFRVLQDMEVKFLVPPSGANEHGNTVNVVAGINGSCIKSVEMSAFEYTRQLLYRVTQWTWKSRLSVWSVV